MEIFSNLPEELQRVVMPYARGMWKATLGTAADVQDL